MDQKKTINLKNILLCCAVWLLSSLSVAAEEVSHVVFCDKKYEYEVGKDSITLYFKLQDEAKNSIKNLSARALENLVVYEDGQAISDESFTVQMLSGGRRIPGDYTFSILVDQNVPGSDKLQIYEAVRGLVEAAPEGCVYISFFGNEVTESKAINTQNFDSFKSLFLESATRKFFYGSLYSKIAEFDNRQSDVDEKVKTSPGYKKNKEIAERAKYNTEKNVLFLFTDGTQLPDADDKVIWTNVEDYSGDNSNIVPRVYAFYTGSEIVDYVEMALSVVTGPQDKDGHPIENRQGKYMQSDDMNEILESFQQVVANEMYDYAYTYSATPGKVYTGKVHYTARWGEAEVGQGDFSIGSVERPWPQKAETTRDSLKKYLVAVLVALVMMLLYVVVTKIIIPLYESKTFVLKYYKPYKPEANVNRMICSYCRQELKPGDQVVVKCKHIMHVGCWQANHYRCVEYGQNCNAIQQRVVWSETFSKASLKDCSQTFAGIAAGLVGWIVYELTGRGGAFTSFSRQITSMFLTGSDQSMGLFDDCANKISAFLAIGLLLGFFLSLVFRYYDEYRNKNAKIYLKILGLSLLSAVIGMGAFILGGMILCTMLTISGTSYIPWYCSLPAYLLFSLCTALSLTIKSSIPVKSALLGGLLSAVIGFVVLYFSHLISSSYEWMNMLLNFIIYGGGLGASLVTVRFFAEKYFLDVKNGVRAGLRIPIHKWMNATGGGKTVTIGMTRDCEIEMNWEKSNKVAKEHARLYVDHERKLPMLKPLAIGVVFNSRAELPANKATVLSNGDTFKIGDTIFQYVEIS